MTPTIVGNGSEPRDGFNLTVDTTAGLEWLDLTLSTGLSFDEVAAELGPGGLFEGFRHATAAEIATFWGNAGITVPNQFALEDPNVNPLIGTWGVTRDPAFLDHSFANYDDSIDGSAAALHGMAFLSSNSRGTEQAEFMADYDFACGLYPSNFSEAGSALVRPVPVPVNQPPTISEQEFFLDENQTLIGTVAAFDPDLGDTLTFSITGGGPDDATFSISSAGETELCDASGLRIAQRRWRDPGRQYVLGGTPRDGWSRRE